MTMKIPNRFVLWMLPCIVASLLCRPAVAFSTLRQQQKWRQNDAVIARPKLTVLYNTPSAGSKYEFQYSDRPAKAKRALLPKIGDIVRYYDLDGGKEDGEVLIGKISFIQKKVGGDNEWIAELSQLEDVGDGYYTEYGFMKRQSKKDLRDLEKVAPVAASFVRSEGAFKIPRTSGTLLPIVRQERYDLESYEGPTASLEINEEVVAADGEIYAKLKGELIRNAALTGFVGALILDLAKGLEDAVIFAAGAAAGVAYLFFLSVKTDTVASDESKLGSTVSALRFFVPPLVLGAVAIYNKSLGSMSPVSDGGIFTTVTPEQFASAIVGFLTYRVPLFIYQVRELLNEGDDSKEDSGPVIPGSIGVAMRLAEKDANSKMGALSRDDIEGLTPVLLVSGPEAAGRSELVQNLIAESNGKFVPPEPMDKVQDGAAFERAESRGEFLSVDDSGRYGFTKESFLSVGQPGESVVVVDASVSLVKELLNVGGARLIGVWVGLDSVDKYQARIEEKIASGQLIVPEESTKSDLIRSKTKDIVKDIEYGLISGIFEFTILNDDPSKSLEELKTASEYCFK